MAGTQRTRVCWGPARRDCSANWLARGQPADGGDCLHVRRRQVFVIAANHPAFACVVWLGGQRSVTPAGKSSALQESLHVAKVHCHRRRGERFDA